MAQKKDKTRKNKLENFKKQVKQNQKKMSEKTEIPNLRSFPVWKSQDTIEVSGLEWESIYNALNIFRQAIVASESVMQKNSAKGVITTKFIDENDQEVAPEQVEEYTKKLQAYFAKKAAEEGMTVAPEASSENEVIEESPILTETGEKAKSKKASPLKSV